MAKKQRISIADGVLVCEYPSIDKVFRGKLASLPESVYRKCDAADHGIKQKAGDAESGKSAAEKYAEVQLIWDSLLQGEWNRTATADPIPMILECVARIKKVPLEKVQAAAAKLTDEEVRGWGTSNEVKAEKLKILAERAKERAKAPEAKLGKITGIDA